MFPGQKSLLNTDILYVLQLSEHTCMMSSCCQQPVTLASKHTRCVCPAPSAGSAAQVWLFFSGVFGLSQRGLSSAPEAPFQIAAKFASDAPPPSLPPVTRNQK